jgi:hypothetical protein
VRPGIYRQTDLGRESHYRRGKLGQGLLGCTFHDFTKQKVIRIAVDELISGDVEAFLTHDEIDHFIVGMEV